RTLPGPRSPSSSAAAARATSTSPPIASLTRISIPKRRKGSPSDLQKSGRHGRGTSPPGGSPMRTRFRDRASHITLAVVLGMAPLFVAHAGEWPMLGRDATRNAVSPEKIAPTHWQVARGQNVRWEAQLGYGTLASPVVAGGLVWVGTDNRSPRD